MITDTCNLSLYISPVPHSSFHPITHTFFPLPKPPHQSSSPFASFISFHYLSSLFHSPSLSSPHLLFYLIFLTYPSLFPSFPSFSISSFLSLTLSFRSSPLQFFFFSSSYFLYLTSYLLLFLPYLPPFPFLLSPYLSSPLTRFPSPSLPSPASPLLLSPHPFSSPSLPLPIPLFPPKHQKRKD